MRNTNYYLTLSGLAFLIAFCLSGCTGESNRPEEGKEINDMTLGSTVIEDTLCKLFRPSQLRGLGLPVSANEYRYIRGYSYFAYDVLDSGRSVLPELVDPTVKLEDLIGYCLSGDTNLYNGIRLYPGLSEDNKFFTIACLAKEGNNTPEISYRIFENSDYISNPFPMEPPPGKSLLLHTKYIERMRIFGIKPDYGSENKKNRISRFYYWKELHEFFKSNIDQFNIKQVDSYRNYKVKMEIGYIPDFLTDDYNNLRSMGNKEFYEGFTIIFQLLDRNGNPLIDPAATRELGNPYNYKNLYLEVGTPCPPVCGALHPAP